MSLPKRDAAASSSGTPRQLVFLNPLTRLFLVAATALLVSCGGGSSPPTPSPAPATSASAVIGAAGGTLNGPDGVQVIIPAGALDADTTIGIARSPQGAPPAPDAFPPAAGYTYELTPHGLAFNSLVTVRAPVPGGAAAPPVFMASVGEDWKLMDAQVVNGMLEWQRNSFSHLLIGTGCFVPTAMANDPYWCRHSISYARVTATPSAAMVQTSTGDPIQGDAGSYRVDQAATLQFRTIFSIPGNCSNVAVKLRRFVYEGSNTGTGVSPIVSVLQTKTPALTVDGGVNRGVETFDLPFAHTLAGRNLFSVVIHYDCPTVTRSSGAVTGWNHSVLRSQYVGDGMIVVGNVPAPTVFYTVGGSVSGLTGAGLALQNNGADNLAVTANGAISFATQVGEGTPYAVTVLTQPVGQACTVANGSGTANATVTNVAVSCAAVSAAKAWQVAAVLDADAGDTYSPQVVFDANGNGMVVWIQHDGTYLRIKSRRYTPSGGWGAILPVDNGGPAMALSPKIAVDGSGNVRVVWLQPAAAGTTTSIWTNLYNPSTGWGTAALLENNLSSVGGTDPQIAMDAAGNATLVWQVFDGVWTNLWAKRFTAGGTWGVATLIENDNNGGVGGQRVVMDANGNAMVVWAQFDFVGQRTNLLANRYLMGSGWGTATSIETSDLSPSTPSIAVDGAGNVMAAWHQPTTANTSTLFSTYTNRFSSGAWGTAELVKSAIPYGTQRSLAMNAAGNAVLVWLEDDGFDTSSIWARVYNAAGVGGAIVRIDNQSLFTDGRTPQVGIDASGNAVAVWGQGSHIWSARYLAGTGWQAPTNIDSAAATVSANQPGIAVDANGNALAVWERSNGTAADIWVNVFK